MTNPETIDSLTSGKSDYIYPEVINVPTYDYGNSQNQLDAPIALRNLGGSVKMLIFDRLSSVGTGTQSFTGFGFRPTSYTVQATRTSTTTTGFPCFSDGAYDGTNQLNRQVADGYSTTQTDRVLRVFYTNQGGGRTSANHSSLDSDGITLNFTDSGENIKLIITCFG